MPRKHTARVTPPADPNYMLSLERGLAVIRAFGGRPTLSIAEAARETGISRAAARRCLHTLQVLGYVYGEAGTYELSPRVLALGYAYVGSAVIAHAAQPVLEHVSQHLHESCSMSVFEGDDIVYVARADTRRIISVGLAVGSRLPAYCTSMGRVLLAALAEPERDAYFSRTPLVRHTRITLTDESSIRAELVRVAAQSYALVDQELEIGLRSIAVPVRGPGGSVVAAINVGVQATRIERRTMVREFLPVLRDAAEEIGFALQHTAR